jgi:hypothetical protein
LCWIFLKPVTLFNVITETAIFITAMMSMEQISLPKQPNRQNLNLRVYKDATTPRLSIKLYTQVPLPQCIGPSDGSFAFWRQNKCSCGALWIDGNTNKRMLNGSQNTSAQTTTTTTTKANNIQ